ncbi:hypothetical protein KW801_01920 [Candidatus Saccharibacteria bacterium]|nr:hypothetical protein [Candidatus Saccharibacteria bacterium]
MALSMIENAGFPRIVRGGRTLLPQEECPICGSSALFQHQGKRHRHLRLA